MLDPEQVRNESMSPSLFYDTMSCIHQDEGEVCGRSSGHHIAGVLNVPRRVCDNEFSARSGEVPVGNVNRDALFAFRSQPIRQKGKVKVFVPSLLACLFDCLELIFEDCLGVMKESSD